MGLIVVLLIGLSAHTQNSNLIQWNVTNDSLVAPWYIGSDNDSEIQDSAQYVTSPFTCIFGQVLNIPNPYGKTYRLEYDVASNAYTQCHIWINEYNGYVVNAPNPMPISSDMVHYSMEFTYMQDTWYSIEFRTLPNFATWIKVKNVSLIEVFPVGIELTTNNIKTGTTEYYSIQGIKLTQEPSQGFYFKRVGNKFIKYYKLVK